MAHAPQPRCPIRPDQRCTLCQLGVTGPADCGLVYLVMHDPDLRDGLARQTRVPEPEPGLVPRAA